MDLPIYQLDAFAEAPFAGNPAAVVPLETWLADVTLQSIAQENNLSETAYLVPVETGDADFEIRWFTPTTEVELCGHATLASAAALFGPLGFDGDEVRFATRQAGPLTARRHGDRVQLDFPARPAVTVPPPAGIQQALGVAPLAFLRAVAHMAVLEDEAAVRAVRFDRDFLLGLEGDGLIVTAPGDACDCVSRYFAPHAGIDEDPVTGSAHCTIAPYWAHRLGRTTLHARQVSARGGDLTCEVVGERVRLAGRARLYLEGTIHL